MCVPKTAMSQGSVLTDVLVKVDSSSITASQAQQALSDSLAGVSGTLGSGLGTQNISGLFNGLSGFMRDLIMKDF